MELYLVQHGAAESEDIDPKRPLSALGKEEVAKVASRAAGMGIRPAGILHSPKLRAEQTAAMLSEALGCPASVSDVLKPNDEPALARDMLGNQSVMLVGHLPHLDRLSSLLLCRDSEAGIVSFRMGAIVCLVKDVKWKVGWILTPEMLR
jgi:phosphohistidine phosphatase